MPSAHLQISAEVPQSLAFTGLRMDGRIAYTVSVENRSTVPAQLPFFCLTDLGFNLEAHRNWQMDRIASDGRRLVRFSYRGSASLLPGNRIAVCNLILRVSAQHGGQATFGQGSPMAIEKLRDLRLHAVSGAANFPAQRSTLEVRVEHLRKAIAEGLAGLSAGDHRIAI